jgi:hypothetical protein
MSHDANVDGPRDRRMWHITLTVVGAPLVADDVCAALERLADHHQFLLSARYSTDRAEVRYWDEGSDVRSAAARALLMWNDYGELAALPPWDVVGLEVVDQDTYQGRGHLAESPLNSVGAGNVRPF